MYCPHCGADEMKVLETRESEMSNSIRRRRECLGCGRRFTSYESIKHPPVTVVKRSGKKEPLNFDKIKTSLEIALRKRPISQSVIAQMHKEIEKEIFSQSTDRGYIESRVIGEIILNQLKGLDVTAYVRFASVYFSFSDVKAFISFIENISS